MDTRGFGALRPHTVIGTRFRPALAALMVPLVALGLTATAAPTQAQPAGTVVVRTAGALAPDTYEERVQRLVNLRRERHGLRHVRFAQCADGTAERWSRFLAANNVFYHQSMTTVLNACDASYAGETLGRGPMTPRGLVRMWMNSSGHRAILLSRKARRIGVGATPDASGNWVVAANFIRF